MNRIFSCLVLGLLLLSCQSPQLPKPRGELRLDLAPHSYRPSTVPCPYETEVADISVEAMRKLDEGNCWVDLRYPKQNATLYLTYKPVNNDLKTLLDEAHKLTYEHHIIADGIASKNFADETHRVYGTLFEVSGEVASNTQFYLTDSTQHFLRGALYFNCAPNEDSLAPVTQYIREDILHMIEGLRWKD